MDTETHRIVAWTPYGREQTVSILLKYMIRDYNAGIIDEWLLYMNLDDNQHSDRAYGYALAQEYDFIRTVERPAHEPRQEPKQINTIYFYQYAVEPNTIYVRLDDDIVYVHPDAIRRISESQTRKAFDGISFPLIWNNAICSWYLQQCGKIPTDYGVVQSPYCMDPIGWADANFAENIHRLLLKHINENTVDQLFLHMDIQLQVSQQFSVSCFAANSDMYRAFTPMGKIPYHEEETWHTVVRTGQTNVPNMIIGDALVSHLSFYPHSAHIRENTDILQQYRSLAEGL